MKQQARRGDKWLLSVTWIGLMKNTFFQCACIILKVLVPPHNWTMQTSLVQYKEMYWVPRPGREASWKEYGSLQMIKKDISLGGLSRASSLIFQCLAYKEVPPGIQVIRSPVQNLNSLPTLVPCLTPCIFPSPQPSCFLHFFKLLYIYSSLPCNKRMGEISLKLYQKEKDGVETKIPAIYTQ